MPSDARDRLFSKWLQSDKTILSPCLKEEDETGSNGSVGKTSHSPPESEVSSSETEADPWSQIVIDAQVEKFIALFTNFISENGDNQVNIGAKLRKRIETDVADKEAIQTDVFTEAVLEILELLYMDSYKRFVKARNDEISANGSASSFGSVNSEASLLSNPQLIKRF